MMGPSVYSVDRCPRLLMAGLAALSGILASVASAALATRLPLTERALFTGVRGKRLSQTIMAATFAVTSRRPV